MAYGSGKRVSSFIFKKSPSIKLDDSCGKLHCRYATLSVSISTTLREDMFCLFDRYFVKTPMPGPISKTSVCPTRLSAIRLAMLSSLRKCCPRCFLAFTFSMTILNTKKEARLDASFFVSDLPIIRPIPSVGMQLRSNLCLSFSSAPQPKPWPRECTLGSKECFL